MSQPFRGAAHKGVDFASPQWGDYLSWHGTPVTAAWPGIATVVRSALNYGIYAYTKSPGGDCLYAHLADALVQNNEHVVTGQRIGYVGYTGNCEPVGARGTHLHFGWRPQPYAMGTGARGYIDPLPLMD